VSQEGKEYEQDTLLVDPNPALRARLYPGSTHEGWTTFLVATADARPLMAFGRNADGTAGAWFKLGWE
jgi:hypothetical protein